MEIIAFIVTVVFGVLSEATIGTKFNMPGIGAIVAVAIMGAFIIHIPDVPWVSTYGREKLFLPLWSCIQK